PLYTTTLHDALPIFQTKSTVVNRALTDIDVLTLTSTDVYAYVNYMQIKEGAVVFSKSVEIRKKLDESDEELLAFAAQELRLGNRSESTRLNSSHVKR